MRQDLMTHAGSEVQELWQNHQEEKRKSSRRCSVAVATHAVSIQDALFSHTDKLIAWHDDYTKSRSILESQSLESYELYKEQVKSFNKKDEERAGVFHDA